MITSTIPGEGKTLISCNTAAGFARHGRKTLLIDCDLRRPMLHRHFHQTNDTGLIQWFEAGAHTDTDLERDPNLGIIKLDENLSLLTSGGRSKSPTELLESPQFGHLLEKLKKHYELVIVDSPPLGAVTDSLLIAQRTDEVIYVCRFNRAFRKHIRLYIKALKNAKNEVLGVVLNGLSPRRIEYYSNYRYYRSYKKYYGSQS
ncbi:MAG: CpsD/CapB family tyrosine-protein kinase [Opitutaceae bacterium]|nr:CpsD/CapB family tyrosine-protein kinase [Opitutaceae bacterium]